MKRIQEIVEKKTKLAIGLMSGTSVDGIDAALVEISGKGLQTKVNLIGFHTLPFSGEVRAAILNMAEGKEIKIEDVCRLNYFLGELSADACEKVIEIAGKRKEDIDFVGSHGQTVWHEPEETSFLGKDFHSTLQIGEASQIAERLGCPVVSDFRTRDVAAGGLGAPLVPYTEFVLYQDSERNIGLQNIGGIGNISILKKNGTMEDVFAFDTGPGNMLIDGAITELSGGRLTYDRDGEWGKKGKVSKKLLEYLIQEDDFLRLSPPKNSGRERYGRHFLKKVLKQTENMQKEDVIATLTDYTAYSIAYSIEHYCKKEDRPERLIIGGGGANNQTLLERIRLRIPGTEVITNEDIGLSGDAKEAVAFAVLANDCLCGEYNNLPEVTGASHPVIMGKITV